MGAQAAAMPPESFVTHVKAVHRKAMQGQNPILLSASLPIKALSLTFGVRVTAS